jgi:hypothetical protein
MVQSTECEGKILLQVVYLPTQYSGVSSSSTALTVASVAVEFWVRQAIPGMSSLASTPLTMGAGGGVGAGGTSTNMREGPAVVVSLR